MPLDWFPPVNAALNGLATALLLVGFFLIRSEKKKAHAISMASAFVVSVIFLISYVTHKALRSASGGEINTSFAGEGVWAWIYYPMLISHVLLAVVIVPLVLRTLYLAAKQRFDLHRKWAKVTFPLWLYVSVTGVLVYFFLYQWFPAESA